MIFSLVFESFLQHPSKGLSVDQYLLHMKMHRTRVKRLAVLLYERFQNQFANVNPELVTEFIDLHDLSKVNDQYSLHNPISKRLAETFGKDQNLPEIQETIGAAVLELNDIDQGLAREFFQSKGLLAEDGTYSETAIELLRIERIADLVDRGFDRIAHIEFGRQLSRASEFLVNETDQVMALYLEDIYPQEMIKVESDHSGAILKELLRSSR